MISVAASESIGKFKNLSFSVHPQCALCLCGECFSWQIHHRGTEFTEFAQRLEVIPTDSFAGFVFFGTRPQDAPLRSPLANAAGVDDNIDIFIRAPASH